MGRNRVLARLGKVLVVSGMSAILVSSSWAEGKEKSAKEKTLHNFTFKSDGAFPFAGTSFDAKGNLYGASYFAGAPDEGICCGAVFQLPPDKNNWKFNVIHSFTAGVTDGETPSGSVVFDSSGNLYGTTQQGDSITGCGSVYELSPTAKGEWKETILHAFNPVPILGGSAGGARP